MCSARAHPNVFRPLLPRFLHFLSSQPPICARLLHDAPPACAFAARHIWPKLSWQQRPAFLIGQPHTPAFLTAVDWSQQSCFFSLGGFAAGQTRPFGPITPTNHGSPATLAGASTQQQKCQHITADRRDRLAHSFGLLVRGRRCFCFRIRQSTMQDRRREALAWTALSLNLRQQGCPSPRVPPVMLWLQCQSDHLRCSCRRKPTRSASLVGTPHCSGAV